MKIKNKGKVHPSPSSSSSSDGVVLSVLQLLPAAILALASVLSLDDREVLAYMITRSMKTSPASFSNSNTQDSKKRASKKQPSNSKTETNKGNNYNNHHQFDCECFDCYRSYWFRWDSSPNRELIHQAIEAFEDHLAHGEKSNKKTAGRGKRRDKIGRREAQKPADSCTKDEVFVVAAEEEEVVVNVGVSSAPEVVLPPLCEVVAVEKVEEVEEEVGEVKVEATAEEVALSVRAAAVSNHKGLVRKVLPDVLGLFNSRLWSLWSPNA
ncbi:uncharacterized protein LOC126791402 [Argentina anserina]|uniref:uncharacterized protein LOC126791402 n=1 Tax=Argentina anserina TaxID=57926 RepID=UPI00217675A7|nr:uncharacterized protein LOC126791402 [Potentilla anserina]